MVNVDKLRGVIAERGLSQRQVARMLGISEKTFYSRMKTGRFWSSEINKLISLLDITQPKDIFFPTVVHDTHQDPNLLLYHNHCTIVWTLEGGVFMTLLDIERLDREFLRAEDISPYIGLKPQSIRAQAQDNPDKLGFPVIVSGTRVLIPKEGFVNFCRFGRPVLQNA